MILYNTLTSSVERGRPVMSWAKKGKDQIFQGKKSVMGSQVGGGHIRSAALKMDFL